MQACDSLMGDVGGEAHKYSQSFLNLNFKFFLLCSICCLFKSELHGRHGEWREMKDGTMKERGGESFGRREKKRAQWFVSLKTPFRFSCVSGSFAWFCADEQKERVGETRHTHTHTHTDVHLSSPTKPNSLRGSKATPFCFGPIGADTDRHHCNALHWFSSTRSSSCPSDVQKGTATVAKGHFLRNTRICYGLDKSC